MTTSTPNSRSGDLRGTSQYLRDLDRLAEAATTLWSSCTRESGQSSVRGDETAPDDIEPVSGSVDAWNGG
jgi:hypothetical protein